MKTLARPALRQPVVAFTAKLCEGRDEIPLTEFAALFGADEALLEKVKARGDLVFLGEKFSNDGPELVVPTGSVELEIPSLLHGTWAASDMGFTLAFPVADYTIRACATVAFFRKCFELKELRATASDLTLDFGGSLADRRYTF